MENIDVKNFMSACLISAGVLFILSFGFVCIRSNYQLSAPLILIYLFEIASQCLVFTNLFTNLDKRAEKELWAAKFSLHWLALAIFTVEYIKIAT